MNGNRLTKSFGLDKEEYKMGIKTKAELEVSEDEYNYKLQKVPLQMESLETRFGCDAHRKEFAENDLEREQKNRKRSNGTDG